MALPVIATTGVALRNQADRAAAPATATFGALPQRSEIYDASGHLMAYFYGVNGGKGATASGVDRQPVAYNQIAPVMRKAIVAIEDDRYWTDGALDLKGTVRALVNDLEHKPVQGGSTITQQYVKNMLILSAPNPQQASTYYQDTLSRKLHELKLAIAVEHQQSKQQILAGYLNDAYFGNLAYGIEVAARTYFNTSAASLTLPQAALLAGMVENPAGYDPYMHPATAKERRNTVLALMAQTHVLAPAAAAAAEKKPLGVGHYTPENGCTQDMAGSGAFFCQYVEELILHDNSIAATPAARARLLATGGLKIYTTLDPEDQKAAADAVNYEVPNDQTYNPGHNADTEVIVQPGTGYVKAMAEDRPYGTNGTTINYAVDNEYGFGSGIQAGSSAKLFTLITALEQNKPFGMTKNVPYSETLTGFTNCSGGAAGSGPAGPGSWQLHNAGTSDHGTYSLYTATVQSINTYFAELEKQVGLCNVVKTAAALGVHRANGMSLWQGVGKPSSANYQYPADDLPSFTLGALNVSPLTMAAAYATVADRGTYCAPVAMTKIVTSAGHTLPVPASSCHRAISPQIADAVNYVLSGVLTQPGATASGEGIGRPAAGKTGTGDGPYYVDFAGYTPTMAAYVSVFYPSRELALTGTNSCYRGGCPGIMYGANAPAQTWQMSFEHANLGPAKNFVAVPGNSPFMSQGNGQSVRQNNNGGGKGKGGNGGGKGNGNNCFFFICPGGGGGNGGNGGGNGGGGNGGGGNGGGGGGNSPGGGGGGANGGPIHG